MIKQTALFIHFEYSSLTNIEQIIPTEAINNNKSENVL